MESGKAVSTILSQPTVCKYFAKPFWRGLSFNNIYTSYFRLSKTSQVYYSMKFYMRWIDGCRWDEFDHYQ